MRVDGGASSNNLLLQFQADISELKNIRSAYLESTALGAAFLAGLGCGFWTEEELMKKWEADAVFESEMMDEQRQKLLSMWDKAIQRSVNWET